VRLPLDTWGTVVSPPPDEPDLQRVRVERATAGYHVIVVQPSGVFDHWLEHESEVLDYLHSMKVEWEDGPKTAEQSPASHTRSPADATSAETSVSSPTDTAELLRGLSSADVMVRRQSLHLLLERPEQALPPLVQLLLDREAPLMARVWATIGLGKLVPDDGGQVESALHTALSSDEATLRWATLRAIGRLRLHRLTPAVAELITDRESVNWVWDETTPGDAAKAALEAMAPAVAEQPDPIFVRWVPGAPLPATAQPYVALLWDHGTVPMSGLEQLAQLIADSRCVYAVCGGARSQLLESLVDDAYVVRAVSDIDEPDHIVTTAHGGESPSEVAWFLFYCALPAAEPFQRVVCHVGGVDEQQLVLDAAVRTQQLEAAIPADRDQSFEA